MKTILFNKISFDKLTIYYFSSNNNIIVQKKIIKFIIIFDTNKNSIFNYIKNKIKILRNEFVSYYCICTLILLLERKEIYIMIITELKLEI